MYVYMVLCCMRFAWRYSMKRTCIAFYSRKWGLKSWYQPNYSASNISHSPNPPLIIYLTSSSRLFAAWYLPLDFTLWWKTLLTPTARFRQLPYAHTSPPTPNQNVRLTHTSDPKIGPTITAENGHLCRHRAIVQASHLQIVQLSSTAADSGLSAFVEAWTAVHDPNSSSGRSGVLRVI